MNGEKRNTYGFWVRQPEGKKPLRRPRWILVRKDGVLWTGTVWLRIETSGGIM
jgi:hypothetical protein